MTDGKPWPIPQPMTQEDVCTQLEQYVDSGELIVSTDQVFVRDFSATTVVDARGYLLCVDGVLDIICTLAPEQGKSGVRSEIADAVREWADKLEASE